jgi:hypothetical protein
MWRTVLQARLLEPFQETRSVLHKGSWGDWTLGNHLDMLEFFAVPQMAHLQPNVFFQQDGSPPHWGPTVWEFSKQTDWAGPLVGVVFLFWGHIKDQVFRPKVASVVELRALISNTAASVIPQMLRNTWREIEYRLGILRATNGAQIEEYWTWRVVPSSKATSSLRLV